MTASQRFDSRKYAKLLAKSLPVVVETEEENERLLAEVDRLMDKEELSPEESRLFDLMVKLIEDYEDRHYELHASNPRGILEELMQAREIKPKQLWSVLGSKGLTSEVLSGKRGISKTQAKALGKFFRVSPELFI
jgi:HTH-type transcriptional regulator/antitoxin HigA